MQCGLAPVMCAGAVACRATTKGTRQAPAAAARVAFPSSFSGKTVRGALGARAGVSARSRVQVKVSAEEAAAAPPAPKKKKKVVKNIVEAMEEDIIPALKDQMTNIDKVQELEVIYDDDDKQLYGSFVNNGGVNYNFWAFFPDGTLEGQRGWAFSQYGYPAGTVEPFIIDEKRIDDATVVFWIRKKVRVSTVVYPKRRHRVVLAKMTCLLAPQAEPMRCLPAPQAEPMRCLP
eukprot:CAMPEP_0182867316 /NCGR_PEP_ID=MMETSP0034_2-20130328/8655_1 /TAXON_ID=156128 /ORGANISM="Nephroselmis pyriformis, Strain CCMP717" /LENGTH=231 /DNA_ID=CAMNT_0024999663 /DNA_START=114 /DNA_END=806 /DNA_ORIENTATION=+